MTYTDRRHFLRIRWLVDVIKFSFQQIRVNLTDIMQSTATRCVIQKNLASRRLSNASTILISITVVWFALIPFGCGWIRFAPIDPYPRTLCLYIVVSYPRFPSVGVGDREISVHDVSERMMSLLQQWCHLCARVANWTYGVSV